MKTVVHNYLSGITSVVDAPAPTATESSVIIRVTHSLVSPGTERTKVRRGGRNIMATVRDRPQAAGEVFASLRQDGIVTTTRKVKARLDQPVPLGYSVAGYVSEVGGAVRGFNVGDRVAGIGEGFASHAELVRVPELLCARVPDAVSLEDAAFGGLVSIALQAVREADIGIGDVVVVLGLGLVGLLVGQVVRAAGAQVIGMDPSATRCALAQQLGVDFVAASDVRLRELVKGLQGSGADAVIVAAGGGGEGPVRLAGEVAREKGHVVIVGAVPAVLPRDEYYGKELGVVISRAFGPGTYDQRFLNGLDYPFGYVRWTAGRNLSAALGLLERQHVRTDGLVSDRCPIADAPTLYARLRDPGVSGQILAAIFTYGSDGQVPSHVCAQEPNISQIPAYQSSMHTGLVSAPGRGGKIRLGVIGCGQFCETILLPALRRTGSVSLVAVATGTPVRAQHVHVKYGFERSTTNYKEILAAGDIDAVVIATRHNSHAHICAAALRAGKDVFLEKPFAICLEDLNVIERAYQESGADRIVVVGYNRRHSRWVHAAKRYLGSGPFDIVVRVAAGRLRRDHWASDPQEGGRVVGEVCHFVDLVQYLTDSVPIEVHVSTSTLGKTAPAVEDVQATLRMSDGSVAHVAYLARGGRVPSRERIEIFGSHRTAIIEGYRGLYAGDAQHHRRWRALSVDLGYDTEAKCFVDAIRNRAMPSTIKELRVGTEATLAIAGVYRFGEDR